MPSPTPRRVARIRERDGDLCCYCGEPMVFDRPGRMPAWQWGTQPARATLEHVIDRQHGGTNSPDNLRLAHGRCNNGRNYVPPEEKRRQLLARACAEEAA